MSIGFINDQLWDANPDLTSGLTIVLFTATWYEEGKDTERVLEEFSRSRPGLKVWIYNIDADTTLIKHRYDIKGIPVIALFNNQVLLCTLKGHQALRTVHGAVESVQRDHASAVAV